jgi:hypothetical protein
MSSFDSVNKYRQSQQAFLYDAYNQERCDEFQFPPWRVSSRVVRARSGAERRLPDRGGAGLRAEGNPVEAAFWVDFDFLVGEGERVWSAVVGRTLNARIVVASKPCCFVFPHSFFMEGFSMMG